MDGPRRQRAGAGAPARQPHAHRLHHLSVARQCTDRVIDTGMVDGGDLYARLEQEVLAALSRRPQRPPP
ncbi:MAG: hypothetical protein R3F43_13355 [bacterium]